MGPDETGKRAYLAICAIYRDEAPYLREWIAFHRLVGVERFYLYNNRSRDDHLGALAPYLEEGIAETRDWPLFPGQVVAYEHCVEAHRDDTRWLAFVDVDEFLFSPTGKSLPEVLADFEFAPGVGVNRAVFGTSGHSTPPDGLVIENYLLRAKIGNTAQAIKTIADPARIASCHSCHAFLYTDGPAVDETKAPIEPPIVHASTDTHSLLRVNHYWTKSEAEWRVKTKRPDARGRMRGDAAHDKALGGILNEERDETITRYLPAVKEALAEVESRAVRAGAG
jgi:hypothetical protein